MEAIWQLPPVAQGRNTEDAPSVCDSGIWIKRHKFWQGGNPVYLSISLLKNFESNDQRRLHWVDSVIVGADTFYFPFKYKISEQGFPVDEYLMVFRLSEQYLIRAEARLRQGNLLGALEDLNLIRSRAGMAGISIDNEEEILSILLHERQIELFSEWSHRWLDLKRTNEIDEVLSAITPLEGRNLEF